MTWLLWARFLLLGSLLAAAVLLAWSVASVRD
jgi:hypothetical protein